MLHVSDNDRGACTAYFWLAAAACHFTAELLLEDDLPVVSEDAFPKIATSPWPKTTRAI